MINAKRICTAQEMTVLLRKMADDLEIALPPNMVVELEVNLSVTGVVENSPVKPIAIGCDHHEVNAAVEINRLADVEPMRFFAEVKIFCDGCNKSFHFIGVNEYGFSADAPSLDVTSTTITLPIALGEKKFIPTKLKYEAIQ